MRKLAIATSVFAVLATQAHAADLSGTLGVPGGGQKCLWTTIKPLGSEPIRIGENIFPTASSPIPGLTAAQVVQYTYWGTWIVGMRGMNGTVQLDGTSFNCGGQSTLGVEAFGAAD